jgi:hypothetical protein
MTYADAAKAWIQNAPEADIHIGRFTLKFYFTASRDWCWCWDFKRWLTPDEYRGSPEHNYLDRILDGLDASYYDIEFIDRLQEAMQAKPFNQGENYEI